MNGTLVDTHVHFHNCFRLTAFLEAARSNLQRVHVDSLTNHVSGCLLLAQVPPGDPLEPLRQRTDCLSGAWKLESLAESDAMVFARLHEPMLAIVAGRQLVTREGLELLALATSQELASGRSLTDSVRETLDVGGIPVLPWGFGKWWFQRGTTMRRFLQSEAAELGVFLGDNGCRPHSLGTPRLLSCGMQQGLRVIAGSDLLPLADHEPRVASYGSVLPGTIDWQRPTAWVRDQLAALQRSPATFGSGRSINRFVQDQIRLCIAKA